MDNYELAWWVVAGMAVVGALATWQLLQPLRSVTLRLIIVACTVAFFVVPTGIPRLTEDALAPAFVVLVFEAFFQTDGEPAGSMLALALGLGAAALLAAVTGFLLSRRGRAD